MAKKIYYALSSLALFLVASNSFAALTPLVQCGNSQPPYNQPCTFSDMVALVTRIVSFALEYIAIPVTAVMFAWGGIMMAVSAGNESRFGKGKKILTGAAIGLAISLGAWLIVSAILKFTNLPSLSG